MIDKFESIYFNYDSIIFLACNARKDFLHKLASFGINVKGIDYDPKFMNSPIFINKDFVFDDVDLDADLVVHANCEKTYPITLKGDVLLIGDNEKHNGDCYPVESVEDLVGWYNVKEIYDSFEIISEQKTHFIVYGRT